MKPEKAFLVIGVVFGLVFLVLVPPFQVPDEPQHFYRAFQVSELRFLDLVALNRNPRTDAFRYGTLLPKSLAGLVDMSDVTETRFGPENKVTPSRLLASFRAHLDAGDREYLPVAPYAPVAYIPQALGIGLGRLLGVPSLVLFYLGRLCALAAWIGLVFVAIKTTPILKWTFFLLALMPMTLHLAASNSADSVVIGVSFLLSAQLLSWAYDARKERIGRADIAGALVMALVLTLSKPLYLVLLALILLVPREKFPRGAKRLLTFGGVVVFCVAAYVGWSLLTAWATVPGPAIELSRHGVDPPVLADISPKRQLALILSHPFAFIGVLATTFSVLSLFYLHSFVGLLGWLDTLLPMWVPYVYVAVVSGVSLLGGAREHVSWRAKCLSFAIPALACLGAFVYFYLGESAVGMKVVVGFQGRYLIPVAPVFFLLFQNHTIRWPVTRTIAAALIVFVTLTTSVAGYRLVQRYYMVDVFLPGPETLARKFMQFWPVLPTASRDRS